jgi:hypothetical protein
MKDIVSTIALAKESGVDLFKKEELVEWLKRRKEFKTLAFINEDYDSVISVFMDLY